MGSALSFLNPSAKFKDAEVSILLRQTPSESVRRAARNRAATMVAALLLDLAALKHVFDPFDQPSAEGKVLSYASLSVTAMGHTLGMAILVTIVY